MDFVSDYLVYIETVRRYSPRTVEIYAQVLEEYFSFYEDIDGLEALTPQLVRTYEVHLMDERGLSARSVNQHLSVLSSLCKYLIRKGMLDSNPVRLITRPKMAKRLPQVYREDSMEEYFEQTEHAASEDGFKLFEAEMAAFGPSKYALRLYDERLKRMIISLLGATGIRRAELISLTNSSIDFSRGTLTVHGKGDKVREVPVVQSVLDELRLCMKCRDMIYPEFSAPQKPLLLTSTARPLYPVFVDRAVKAELGSVSGITGRKSPHVLRHTIATQLLDDGADINSIKEMLGHSSLAATQVYTHNSIAKLKSVYMAAHPRSKK